MEEVRGETAVDFPHQSAAAGEKEDCTPDCAGDLPEGSLIFACTFSYHCRGASGPLGRGPMSSKGKYEDVLPCTWMREDRV
jgi:hypothetical protein